MKHLTDDELVSRLKQSDAQAFSEIFRRYKGSMIPYAMSKINDRELAKDLVHDIFTNVWDKRETVYIGELKPFLLKSTSNIINDHYKHIMVQRKYVSHHMYYTSGIDNKTPDHLVRHNQMVEILNNAIDMLPKKMATIFKLSRHEYMNRNEISTHLNVCHNTVRTNMTRALSKLKIKLRHHV